MISFSDNIEYCNFYRPARPFLTTAVTAGVVGAAGSIVSSGVSAAANASSTSAANAANYKTALLNNMFAVKMNQENNEFNATEAEKARQFNSEEAQKSRDFIEQQANIEREYNSIGSQIERAQEAGVNPLSVLGNSSSGAGTPSSPAASGSPATSVGNPSLATPIMQAPDLSALGNIASGSAQLIDAISNGKLRDEEAKLAIARTEGEYLSNVLKQQETITNPDQLLSNIGLTRSNIRSSDAKAEYDLASANNFHTIKYATLFKNALELTNSSLGREIDIKTVQSQIASSMAQHYQTVSAMAADLHNKGINTIYSNGSYDIQGYVDKYFNEHNISWSERDGWKAGANLSGSASISIPFIGDAVVSSSGQYDYSSDETDSSSDTQSSGNEFNSQFINSKLANPDVQKDLICMSVLEELSRLYAGTPEFMKIIRANNKYMNDFSVRFKNTFEQNFQNEVDRYNSLQY